MNAVRARIRRKMVARVARLRDKPATPERLLAVFDALRVIRAIDAGL
jgi:hypothetical protein